MNAITKPGKTAATAVSVPKEPVSAAGQLLNIISAASRDSAVDVSKLTALLDLQERVLAKEAKAAFNAALGRLSSGLPRVQRNGTVDLGTGKGGYKFATWEDMDTILRPRMAREGFTLSFNTKQRDGGGALIYGTLLHVDGHEHTVEIALPLDAGAGRNNLQAMGSTLSYGKRYCADMLFNIVRTDEDDDGVRGGQSFISAEQVADILALIASTESDTDKLLAALKTGARRLEDVQEKDFARVKVALQVKQARKIAGKPDAPDATPSADEDRLDTLELTIAAAAAPPAIEPTQSQIAWCRRAEVHLMDMQSTDDLVEAQAMFAAGLDKLRIDAPALAAKIDASIRAAATRINGALT